MRPTCEQCNKALPSFSEEAMICSFECTFCVECVENVFMSVCPNCGGDFHKRPTRSAELLVKYPASEVILFKPKTIPPNEQ